MRSKLSYTLAVVTALVLLGIIVGSTPGATGTAASPLAAVPGSCWTDVVTPPVGSLGKLHGVAAIAANDVWAVGESRTGGRFQTLIEHWDGTAWNVVPSPNPSAGNNRLNGVAAVAANDVWAVGYDDVGVTSSATLVLHWDGIAWNVVPSPNPPSPGLSPVLNGVAAIAANDIWAVGHFFDGSSSDQTLTMHWDGASWSIVPSANPGLFNNYLKSVAAVSSSDVWAVGYLQGTGGAFRTLALHWNGSSWTPVATPDPGPSENYLNAVTVVSAGDLWAVGRYVDASNVEQTLVLHGDGVSWGVVPSPSPGSSRNNLNGVAAVSANDVWAVGSYGSFSSQVLYEHWDGATWSVVPPANTLDGLAAAIAPLSASDIWAVGWYISVDATRPMAQRLRECILTPTPTPRVTITYTWPIRPVGTIYNAKT